MSAGGHINILDQLYKKLYVDEKRNDDKTYGIICNLFIEAVKYDRIDVLNWCKNNTELNVNTSIISSAEMMAVKKSNLKILIWFHDNYGLNFCSNFCGESLMLSIIKHNNIEAYIWITNINSNDFITENYINSVYCYAKNDDTNMLILLNADGYFITSIGHQKDFCDSAVRNGNINFLRIAMSQNFLLNHIDAIKNLRHTTNLCIVEWLDQIDSTIIDKHINVILPNASRKMMDWLKKTGRIHNNISELVVYGDTMIYYNGASKIIIL